MGIELAVATIRIRADASRLRQDFRRAKKIAEKNLAEIRRRALDVGVRKAVRVSREAQKPIEQRKLETFNNKEALALLAQRRVAVRQANKERLAAIERTATLEKSAERATLGLLKQRRVAVKQAEKERSSIAKQAAQKRAALAKKQARIALSAIRRQVAAEKAAERRKLQAIRQRRTAERASERKRLQAIRQIAMAERAAERKRQVALRAQKKQTKQLGLFSSLAATAAAGIGIVSLKGIVVAAGQFEQITVALTTMLGSTELANEKLAELQEFAARTPFTLPGVENAARSLLAVGFTADELLPTLKSLGDVSSGLGRGEEGLRRLILNMGQVRAQAKLTGRELRDFAILGVPILETLADTLGRDIAEIQQLVQAGEISSKQVIQAFEKMSSAGGKFADLMIKQNKTVLGLFSNIIDELKITQRALGVSLTKAITAAERVIISTVKSVRKLVQATRGAAGAAFVGAVAFAALTAAITSARVAMRFLDITFKQVLIRSGIIIAIIAIGAALGFVVNMIARIITETERGQAAGQRLKEAWDTLGEAAITIFNAIGDLFENVFGVRFMGAISSVEEGFTNLVIAVSKAAIKIANFIKDAAELIAFFMRNASEIAQIAMIDLELAIFSIFPSTEKTFQSIATVIVATFEGVRAFFTSWVDNIKAGFTELKNFAIAIFDGIKAGLDAVFEGKNPLQAVQEAFINTLAAQKDAKSGGNPFKKFQEAFVQTKKEIEAGFRDSGGLANDLLKRRKALQDRINRRELGRRDRRKEEDVIDDKKERKRIIEEKKAGSVGLKGGRFVYLDF